jgi:hypothetical protein
MIQVIGIHSKNRRVKMNGDKPQNLLPQNRAEKNCSGLRSYEPPSSVKVYKVNPDGTRGEFLGIEEATYYGDPKLFPRKADKIRGA